ncbi:MAG: porin family protein [Bauldia sp.]|nr:porin family protein [Bauldia sp.]
MKRVVVIAAALVAAGAGATSAADFGQPATGSSTPSFYVQPTEGPSGGGEWAGFYLGGLAGYVRATFADGITATASGISAGGYAGVNIQNENFVIGVEAGGAWTGVSDGAGNGINWQAELRGRAGFAFDRFLVYGAGGVVVAGVETSTPSTSRELGWTVGAGGEFAIGEAITARVEYVYQRFGEIGAAAPTTLSAQGIRSGIGIRF